MSRYKIYENLPWWLNSLNDNTLRPTEKQTLDLDYYCKKHGTKLSHEQAAKRLQRSRHAVYLARRRLGELRLRTSGPAKGSFLVGRPLEYKNEADWLADLRARGLDPSRLNFKRKSSRRRRPLRGLSSSKVTEASASEAPEAGVSFPQTPGGSTDRCSGEGGDSPPTRKQRDEFLRRVIYDSSLSKLLEAEHPRDQAERLAKIKADRYIAKRKAERKKS